MILFNQLINELFIFLKTALKSSNESNSLSFVDRIDGPNSHLENLGGIFVVLSEQGDILYASENSSRILNREQKELIGRNLASFIHSDDVKKLERHLSREKNNLPETSDNLPMPERGDRKFFHIRFRFGKSFEHVNLMGHYRKIGKREHFSSKNYISASEYVFFGISRLVRDRPIMELSLMEALQDQYITRHSPEGKIIFADHR